LITYKRPVAEISGERGNKEELPGRKKGRIHTEKEAQTPDLSNSQKRG